MYYNLLCCAWSDFLKLAMRKYTETVLWKIESRGDVLTYDMPSLFFVHYIKKKDIIKSQVTSTSFSVFVT